MITRLEDEPAVFSRSLDSTRRSRPKARLRVAAKQAHGSAPVLRLFQIRVIKPTLMLCSFEPIRKEAFERHLHMLNPLFRVDLLRQNSYRVARGRCGCRVWRAFERREQEPVLMP